MVSLSPHGFALFFSGRSYITLLVECDTVYVSCDECPNKLKKHELKLGCDTCMKACEFPKNRYVILCIYYWLILNIYIYIYIDDAKNQWLSSSS